MTFLRTTHTIKQRQHGAVFIVMLVFLIIGITAFLVSSLSSTAIQISRDEITSKALAQAKEALIGYAASIQIDSTTCSAPGNNCARLGDLPCPDINNDGLAENSCGNASGSTGQTLRIGRLPWKTLGLPDLRDGSGERLWYAVSNNFKSNTRTSCTVSGQAGCLNSDTTGTISVFTSDGTLINDGGNTTGAVAIIIAPGDTLIRQDALTQTRGCTLGVDCDATDKCTSASPTTVAKCNPKNYLDIATIGSITEDNASFTDGSSTVGFIQGRIKNANGNIIVNDQLITITQDSIMQGIQKRVAGEVRQCLNAYAIDPQNGGRYPWAVPQTASNYLDVTNQLFGRIPDMPFFNTCVDSGGNASGFGTNNCTSSGTPTIGMKNMWVGNCNINSSTGWWLNWADLVFFGVADAYKPVNPPSTPTSCGTCLSVNPPSATADKRFVVIVAGKKLPTQSRSSPSDKGLLGNYLEPPNDLGSSPFSQSAPSSTFNDTVVFQ